MRVGVDLGGTKIEAIALDDDGRESVRLRRATPVAAGYEAIVQTVAGLVRELEARIGNTATVGVGTPGSIDPASELLRGSNTVCLNGRPLARDLSNALAREVRLANDANCFALSEATDGAATGAPIVFGVILGTGTGGGIVISGRPLVGQHAIAGEWGHTPLPWATADEHPGPACWCGRHGCLETWLSGPGLSRDHARSGAPDLPAADIAASNDPRCITTIDRWLSRLARGLAVIIDILDPDVIVLGGGLSNIARAYTELPERLRAHVFTDALRTRIVPPRFGDSSGVRGAAWLWPSEPI